MDLSVRLGDEENIVVIVLGGITPKEIEDVKNQMTQQSGNGKKVTIISNTIATHKTTTNYLFQDINLK